MTDEDFLTEYLRQISEKIDSIKLEIDTFFNEYKEEKNLYSLLIEEFSDKITAFTDKYRGTCPEALVNNAEYVVKSYTKTIDLCNPLVHYLDYLMENGLQNTEKTPSS